MSVLSQSKPWPFAPLDSSRKAAEGTKPLLGIVFDVDGTLCEPQNYMFKEMRDALGIEKPTDILDHIASLPEDKQQEAHDKIEAVERKAMAVQKPQPGLTELMAYLDKRGLQKGICTRNFNEPVAHLIRKFMPDTKFEPIITRAFQPPKPDPAGIKHIAEQWGVSAENLIMVGDSADDTQAGKRAGSATVLLVSEANEHLMEHEYTDIYINRLDELIPLLETGKNPSKSITS